MVRNVFLIAFCTAFFGLTSFSQPAPDNIITNTNKTALKTAGIKSRTIWEYFYNDSGILKDSMKLINFYFDNDGNIVERTKFHIYEELNLKETYQYDGSGKILKTSRYNNNGDVIETGNFKYNKAGMPVRERIIQYYNNPNASFYFSILASVHDDSIFTWLQNDLLIEPHLESYTVTVNLTDNDPQNHYVVIGDEEDATSMRFSWLQLSLPVQKGLLAWSSNKTNHKYVVQNLARIKYTTDIKGNVTSKTYYNTAGNIVKREMFFFNESGYFIGYEKYNSGKLLNKESYSYDDSGNVKEISYTGGRTEYKYDEAKNLIEKIVYNSSNTVFGRSVFEYETGKLTNETIYGPDDAISGKIIYSYDEKGNVIKKTSYNSDNIIEKETKIIYEFY
ncbi:MAG: hypothetical protein EHM58_16120 [Ignavibacteriae bacterium]|nr:MAG: hypothetical protein EHM58_16120 [Ignavibacteriota bacterium]